MASEADIQAVQEQISPTAASEGWDSTKIGAKLDTGLTVDEVTLEYWESRVARTHTLVNVAESGSSRSLSQVFDNALKMANYFKDKTGKTDEEATVRPVRTRGIKRV